ncbi:hypothetical protein J5X84_01210 [Streptosporangiaceae bacterium NEAU-GS5]|nr:hypothetical protein [Streptosporangiaceae bacterium NEAU-GS5]
MWPFIGRAQERDAVRAALRDGAGILVTGEPGAGCSRLLIEVAAAFDHLAVAGNDPHVPFGAFAHVLPISADPARSDPVNPIGWAAAALRIPAVLTVDDAHLLDPQSAALIRHLVLHQGVRVALTARVGLPLPGPIGALWKDGVIARLDMDPLSQRVTGQVLAAALGGPVDTFTLRRLWHVTRGNLRFLTEIVAAGSLILAYGSWRCEGEFVFSDRLLRLAEESIGELDASEREALEYVAFSEPADLDALISLTSQGAVERLERRRLIEVIRQGAQLRVRLGHPLHGQTIRSWSGQVRTRSLLASVTQLRGTDAGAEDGGGALSEREFEVARLAALGLTNREIADWLTLSHRTVGNHLCHVYTKLGVNDRSQLAETLMVM